MNAIEFVLVILGFTICVLVFPVLLVLGVLEIIK